MSAIVRKAAERLREREEQANAGRVTLGDRLLYVVPLRSRWKLDSPGDLLPLTDDEAERCGERPKSLGNLIRAKLRTRSEAEDQEAREAWENIYQIKRRGGPLAATIPVTWAKKLQDLEVAEIDDDIPF
jgi:hypothetical protein